MKDDAPCLVPTFVFSRLGNGRLRQPNIMYGFHCKSLTEIETVYNSLELLPAHEYKCHSCLIATATSCGSVSNGQALTLPWTSPRVVLRIIHRVFLKGFSSVFALRLFLSRRSIVGRCEVPVNYYYYYLDRPPNVYMCTGHQN